VHTSTIEAILEAWETSHEVRGCWCGSVYLALALGESTFAILVGSRYLLLQPSLTINCCSGLTEGAFYLYSGEVTPNMRGVYT
jgi:hypothetical protein